MKVAITGVSGFLGHHVIQACQSKGWYVIGIDKRPLQECHHRPDHFIQTDVFDLGYRDLVGVDYVIHLAFATNIPSSVRHPRETTYQNINMTVHLLEVCRESGVRKVFFPSTASLYGTNTTPWTEDMAPSCLEPYSWQKMSLEALCNLYTKSYGLKIVIGRFFQVFGELQRDDTALAAFLQAKWNGKPITLTETTAQSSFRSGQRDFIYAGDVAEAVCVLLNKGEPGRIYNVCSGKVRTMEEVAGSIGAQVVWIPRREYEVERHEGSPKKLMDLGWRSTVDVLDWLNTYANHPK